ncbi:MAG: glycoside hydrolase family 66 protein [Vallitalea sp.]|jgi:dextranase|nr:glycoside hydrolase family 66 protein [Vallitalea sp.]
MGKYIQDIYPNKAQFLEGEEVEIVIELSKDLDIDLIDINITITKLEEIYMNINKDLHIDNNCDVVIKLNNSFPCGGYGVDVNIHSDNMEYEKLSTAFDVVSNFLDSPRYGFLSEFNDEDILDDQDILYMKKLHINMVQFYDWMYKHEELVSEHSKYVDLMGKSISKDAIINKINLCHKNGMKAIAYGAIYASSTDFYENHKEWALYNSNDKPITFIDVFYIMNIHRTCPWHQHIIDQYEKTITNLNFDGIHMDTYGFPKKGYSKVNNNNELIYLEEHFGELINDTKAKLQQIKEDVALIFNNVGNWPVYSTANANQDVVYVEVWDPYYSYNHIREIIMQARNITNKPIILAAYLKPFMEESQEKAGYALRLLTASIVANGGYHLIMGEEKGVLTQGYYVDYYKMNDNIANVMRKYYDFIVRYSDIFFDQSLIDVTMTHCYGDNMEYQFEGNEFSATADSNKIWTIIKENNCRKVISLINLLGNDINWNKGKVKPNEASKIEIKMQLERNVKNVYIISPENAKPQEIEFEIISNIRENILVLKLCKIDLWTVIVVNLCN